jgi:thymidylate synthase
MRRDRRTTLVRIGRDILPPLSEAGINIWDGNGSRKYPDSVGLSHRAVGDLGPVYGFQWQYFGAEYVDAATDYTGQGVDQLEEVIL